MRIAVISDIHGNMQALEKVLEDINKVNCEKILCLGDLAMAGPEPEKAIIAIKKLHDENDLELIQGNTDAMVANYEKCGDLVKSKFPIMGNALENDAKVVSENSKNFLNTLSEQRELLLDEVKVLMVHGSPRKNDENIFPDMPLEKVEEMIKDTDADLILCGHTHIPCGYQTKTKQTVVNVGSVGRPFTDEPKACYAIIDFQNGTFTVEHKFIEYDKEKAALILSKRNFDGADKMAQILIKPEFRHI